MYPHLSQKINNIQLTHYNIAYTSAGDPSQPAILFLHGFMGDRTVFQLIISHLSARFYCLAVDLPGHGNTQVIPSATPAPEAPNPGRFYQMEPTAHGLIAFLDQLKISTCRLVGYSMGGRVALYLALHFPHYFKKVVLESASPGLKTATERETRLQNDLRLASEFERFNASEFKAFLRQWYRNPIFGSLKDQAHFADMLTQRSQNNPALLAKSLQQLSTGRQPSLWEKLKENRVPLLLLTGELDTKFVAINAEIEQRCTTAQLKRIGNCGHNIHRENSAAFLQHVKPFLA